MYKTNSFRLFIIALLITALAGAFLLLPSCKPHNGGTCTYEGLECPTALAIHTEDSLAYADSITSLRTQLFACETQDHSRIQQSVSTGVIHLTRDTRGLISVVYREKDGNEYALDYITDAEFYSKFGYKATSY